MTGRSGVVGFYQGSVGADGGGDLRAFHWETGCRHMWDVTLTNPRPVQLTPPSPPFSD